MTDGMSTTKENHVWEEKDSIEPKRNCSNNSANGQSDIINVTGTDSTGSRCGDIGIVSGIYKIINRVNGKYYVGSSNEVFGKHGRWVEHVNALRSNRHKNQHLQRSWNKHGESAFNFVLVERVNVPDLLLVEQKYLDVARDERPLCYNAKFKAGGGSSPVDWTPERRKNMSDALRGRVIDEKWKANLKAAAKTKTVSPETKQRLSELKRKRMMGNTIWLGKHHTPETIEKMQKTQQSLIGKIRVKRGTDNPNFDATIYHFVNNKTHDEFVGPKRFFMDKTGFDKATVLSIIRGTRKNRKGWILLPDQ